MNKFWSFFVNNWRITIVVIFALMLGGVFSLFGLPQESDPEVKIPIATVSTVYPGASPGNVEKMVTDKLESRLKNLENLKKLTSTSSEGVSSIVVEFEASANLDKSIRELRDEVDSAKSELPDGANDPIVTEIRAGDVPILTVSLVGDLSAGELKNTAEDLQSAIENTRGVSKVVLSGVRDEEIQILLNRAEMRKYELSVSDVVAVIKAANVDFPMGKVLIDGFYYQVSFAGQFEKDAEVLRNLPIANKNGVLIYLRDVAEVKKDFAERVSEARVFHGGEKILPSATLQIYKKAGANIIEIADDAKAVVREFEKVNLDGKAEIVVTGDNSEFIRDDIKILGRNGLQTIFIIFLLLLLVLSFREALLTGLTIPLIFLVAFLGLGIIGETLNGLTLFALILSLGLIVDTSIVMMEGFYENLDKCSPRGAALRAIRVYKSPLISGTLTTIAAFLPMAMMSGIMGEYVRHIPITVSITLLASLFVALLLLPAVASHVVPRRVVKSERSERFVFIRKKYEGVLRKMLSSREKKWALILIMFFAFVAAVSLPIRGVLPVQMFPSIDVNYFDVKIEAPRGVTLAETDEVTKRVEQKIKDLPELDNFVTILGGGGVGQTGRHSGGRSGGSEGLNLATITVNLTKKEERAARSQDIAEIARGKLQNIVGAKITVEELRAGPPGGAPVEIRIIGGNIGDLEGVAKDVAMELGEIDGVRNVTTDVEYDTGEFEVLPRRGRLAFFGISARGLAREMWGVMSGNDDVKIVENGDETRIVVRNDFRECGECLNYPKSIDEVRNLRVKTVRGFVPLSELADVELNAKIAKIRHRGAKRIISVKADLRDGVLPAVALGAFRENLHKISVPENVKIELGGETEDTMESFASLARAMIIGILLIAGILIFQFNSFRQPFIILLTLPMALIGVFFGLAIIGKNFSFPGFIGIVALSGVVVNDAIVLIDRINVRVKKEFSIEKIVEACGERLQPVILTTLTTAAGVLPLAFSSAMWGDLAWTIVLGIVFATVLTLIFVPVLYVMFYFKKFESSSDHSKLDLESRGGANVFSRFLSGLPLRRDEILNQVRDDKKQKNN